LISLIMYAMAGNMTNKPPNRAFSSSEIQTVNKAVSMAEELVSNYYKMSSSQWLRPKYDVKTVTDLNAHEIIDGPFAQIIRYEGKRKGSPLGSETYDFYKICLQDHTILNALAAYMKMDLLPFCLYVIAHELIHIVRFSKFLQNFDASPNEKVAEEKRVHATTHKILNHVQLPGLDSVIDYFRQWHTPLEDLGNP
jgi:DNA-directed RNA polymerase subunit L